MGLRLLLDENAESTRFKNLLQKAGHDVMCLKELLPKGALDEEVLALAIREKRVLYTQDRDFFEINPQIRKHSGIILEFVTGTPGDMTSKQIVAALAIIESQFPKLTNQLLVVNTFRQKRR